MIQVLQGRGSIEVDFRQYFDWDNRLIFLEPGQYIKFLTETFVLRKIEFGRGEISRNHDERVLFKHLVSLGYVSFTDSVECQKFLNEHALNSDASKIIDISSRQWYWQNPFNATREEYQVIFDVKEMIDKRFRKHVSHEDLTNWLAGYPINPHNLFANKVGITVKRLWGTKRILEAKKALAFSSQSVKEIAHGLGYEDRSYFSRSFKLITGNTPMEFRERHAIEDGDRFVADLLELIEKHHKEHREIEFYANKLYLSVKTLSNKVRSKLQVSPGQLIRQEIMRSAKEMLLHGLPIHEVAFSLGFTEPNHFTTFFRNHTGQAPSSFKAEKSS